MDVAERVALGVVDAERKRRARVPGAEVLEVDGLVLALANVADAALNSVVVERAPEDPTGALEAAEAEFRRRGQAFSVDLQVGRHPSLDVAVREAGLRRVLRRPAMAVGLLDLTTPGFPAGIEVRSVDGEDDADALVEVGVAAFGDDPEVAGRVYALGSHGVSGARSFVGWERGTAVAIATSYVREGAVGIYGVGVVPGARGRGIGAAITGHAARAHERADLAWLHPTERAEPLYRRLRFRPVAEWEVRVRS